MKKALLILMLPSVIFGANIVRYINTGSTAGGNGTTNGTTGDNRAYPSQNVFEAAENADLTDAGGDTMICYLYGVSGDTQAVTYSGWTLSDTCRLTLQGDNYTGKASTCHYRMDGVAVPKYGGAIWIKNSYITCRNIEITNFSSLEYWGVDSGIAVDGNYFKIRIENCIIHDNNSLYLTVNGIRENTDGGSENNDLKIKNCLIYNLHSWYYPKGISFSYNNGQQTYNCTATSMSATSGVAGTAYHAYNYSGSYYPTLINCIAQETETKNYDGQWSTMTAYNISQDTTAATIGWGEKTITFSDRQNRDYSLSSADTDAIDKGADLSSIFTTDIIGTSRPQGSAWDIGAFEYVQSSPAPAPSVPLLPQVMLWEN